MIDIKGLNKADVLAALYNASRPLGMGFLHYDPKPMTGKEAETYAEQTYFDYLKGRVMKVKLQGGEFDERLYDRDNGAGTAQIVVDAVRAGATSSIEIEAIHEVGKTISAEKAKTSMEDQTTYVDGVLHLGLSDVASELGPAIDKVMGGK